MQKYNILYKFQFGFCEGHSTMLANIEIVENIRQEILEGNFVLGAYLDLSKAFDTISHDIMLHKLEHVGVRGLPLNWFKSYLTYRKQNVHVNGADSSLRNMTCGVPQGSVLGPLLFLICINDISEIANNATIHLFADDTNLFIVSDDPNHLKYKAKIVFHNIFEWFAANKVSLNHDKTCYSSFTSLAKLKTLNSIQLDDTVINRVNHAKYLGLILDESISWKEHFKDLIKQLSKLASSYKIVRHRVKRDNKFNIYLAYTYSKILYRIEVYGTAPSELLNKLQIQQNRSLKILFNKHYRMHTSDLYRELNLLKVPLIQNV